jgi:hypothetical protein
MARADRGGSQLSLALTGVKAASRLRSFLSPDPIKTPSIDEFSP